MRRLVEILSPYFIYKSIIHSEALRFISPLRILISNDIPPPSSVPLVIKDPFGGRNFRRNFVVSLLLTHSSAHMINSCVYAKAGHVAGSEIGQICWLTN